ncbi:hypothetical protein V8E51_000494 [Hyaloscypha variabilis]
MRSRWEVATSSLPLISTETQFEDRGSTSCTCDSVKRRCDRPRCTLFKEISIGYPVQALDTRLTAVSLKRGGSFIVTLPLHAEHCSRNRPSIDHLIRNVAS